MIIFKHSWFVWVAITEGSVTSHRSAVCCVDTPTARSSAGVHSTQAGHRLLSGLQLHSRRVSASTHSWGRILVSCTLILHLSIIFHSRYAASQSFIWRWLCICPIQRDVNISLRPSIRLSHSAFCIMLPLFILGRRTVLCQWQMVQKNEHAKRPTDVCV